MFLTHFKFTSQPFAERLSADALWPDDRMQQGLSRLRYVAEHATVALVTGASGGVGSVAVALLAQLGYQVVAVSGRPDNEDYLRGLGAKAVLARDSFSGKPRLLDKQLYSGVVDTVGGPILAALLSQLHYNGVAAACGLAGSVELPTSVMPFILRNVRLQGVDSVWETDLMQPMIDEAQSLTGKKYIVGDYEDRDSFGLRVLAEHSRSSSMLVNDGVFPSNEGRGYVLRRIIRRAVRFAYMLGTESLVMPPAFSIPPKRATSTN